MKESGEGIESLVLVILMSMDGEAGILSLGGA